MIVNSSNCESFTGNNDITILDMKDNIIGNYDNIGSIDWESIYTIYGYQDYMILYSDGSTEKQYYDRYVIKNKFPKY